MVCHTDDLPQKILLEVGENVTLESLQYSHALKEQHQKVIGAIKSLESLGDVSTPLAHIASAAQSVQHGI